MDILSSHLKYLILLTITLDNLPASDMTILIAHSCRNHSSQEDPFIIGEGLCSHMQAHKCLRHGKCHSNEHNLLTLEVCVGNLEMHQCWMSRNHRCHLDRELERLRRKIVVTEVEWSNCGVSVHSVNDVASGLEVYLAMREVKFSDLVWHDKIRWQNPTDMLVCITTRYTQAH